MNKGIQRATGDLIGILNSDDLYTDNNVISDIVELAQNSSAKAIYADLVYVGQYDTKKIKRYWKAGQYKAGLFFTGWMPPHPTFFIKRDCYIKYGSFNLGLKSAADYELMLRMIHKHNISTQYLPRVIVKMRTGGTSNETIRNRIKANIEDRKAWKINNLRPGFFTLYRKPISKILQFLHRDREMI